MESLIKLEKLKQEDGGMGPNVVEKIADIVAHVLASKADVSQTTTVTAAPRFPRQNSLPVGSTPYMPRTPAKECYTLEDFQCKYCLRPFFSKRELSKHTESAHFAEVYKQSYPCSLCTMSYFATPKELAEHMEKFHEDSSAEIDTVCYICNQKFLHPTLVLAHMKIFHVPQCYCHYCGKAFTDLSLLWAHLQETHQTDPDSVCCNLCSIKFSRPNEYTEHIKSQHAFCCTYCDSCLESSAKLKLHYEAVHNRNYCEDCYETFGDLKKYIQHYFATDSCVIPNEKLTCYCCHLKFDSIKALYQHICLHTFSCVACGGKFISCQNYQEHLISVHKIKVSYSDVQSKADAEIVSKSPPLLMLAKQRLTPTVTDRPKIPEFMKGSAAVSNGNTTANYINGLIEANQNLLNSRPVAVSNSSFFDPIVALPGDSMLTNHDAAQFLKLCSTADIMKYLQTKSLSTSAASNNDSIVREPSLEAAMNDDDSSETKIKCISRGDSSFSSIDDDDVGRTDAPEKCGSDGEYNTESRRDSLRLKYQQLSINRKTRRSSKSHLNKILTKTKLDEISDSGVNNQASLQCQRCNKAFPTRSILSRHWASSQTCYICSATVCDLKMLNEHMKSAHAEYNE